MPTRRELAEAQSYRRQLLSVALRGGMPGLRRAESPEHSNRLLYAGAVIAALALLAVAASGYFSSAPAGWRSNGSLVVDRQYGGSYLVEHGTLAPLPNLTSLLLLTNGSPPSAKIVDHHDIQSLPISKPVGVQGVPVQPPIVVPGAGVTACTQGGHTVLVIGSTSGHRQPQTAAVVRTGASTYSLVSGTTSYATSPQALTALGYSTAQAVPVESSWLSLLTAGPPLQLLATGGRPRGGSARAITHEAGAVVIDDGTGQWYVVARAGLRPVLNQTSRLLLSSRSPLKVPHSAVVARPILSPFGESGVPASPPAVPAAGTTAVVCVRPGAGATLFSGVPVASTDVTQQLLTTTVVAAGTSPATVIAAAGHGAVLAVTPTPAQHANGTGPTLYLVANGTTFKLADATVLAALRYPNSAATTVPQAWVSLLPVGPTLPDLHAGS